DAAHDERVARHLRKRADPGRARRAGQGHRGSEGAGQMIDQLPALLAVLAWKSALLLAAAFGIAAAAKRLSASERHVGWCLAMLGLLALPAGHLLGPGYTLPMPEMEVRAVFDRAGQPVEERK